MTESLPRRDSRIDWLLIGLLIALVLPLRGWLIYNTEVTSRDSIGYIRYALQFEKYSWAEVLRKNQQHPGYPAMVWLVSVPVRAIAGETTPENMELAAQLVNLVASLLLILPSYWLGRQFFDRPVAFLGTLLYQYLPTSAQHLSDGISEPVFLVLMMSGLLHGIHAIRERTIWRGALCGLFTGLAYLTRPEGALVLPAFGIVLIALQCRSSWRTTWQRFLACGGAAVLAAVLVGSIYVYATGRITNKPSANDIMGVRNSFAEVTAATPGDGTHLFAVFFPKEGSFGLRLQRSAWALATEINQGFHYIAGIPALLGFLWTFGSLRRDAGYWMVLTFASLHGLLLIALATSQCYVSDRHVMILVLGGCFFAVAGLRDIPRRILARWTPGETGSAPWYRSPVVWSGVLFLALIAFCLPRATQRLHGNRVGNHQAGLWLAEHLEVGDHVEDDHSWSHFFSGKLFTEGKEEAVPTGVTPTCYVVTTRSRDPQIDARRLSGVLTAEARVRYVWPEHADVEKARIVVYSQPRNFATQPWKKGPRRVTEAKRS